MNPNIAPVYFVEVDYGKIGKSFRETDRDKSSREQVVADILSGELENVLCVLEVFEGEGTCQNITSDIAEEVMRRAEIEADDDGLPSYGRLTNFLMEHIGVDTVEAMLGDAVS